MIADWNLLEGDEYEQLIARRKRRPAPSERAVRNAKRTLTGKQRLANQARHARRRSDSFCQTSRSRSGKYAITL